MKTWKAGLLIVILFCLIIKPVYAAKYESLISSKVDLAPSLDCKSKDPQWKKATAINVLAEDGPEITIQSVYTRNEIFFLIQWEDATESIRPDQWIYDGDKWTVLKELRWEDEDPWEAGNDMIGFHWPINDSIEGFDEKGCKKICHAPEKEDRMYTNKPGEMTDIWLWKSGLTNPAGYADSYYLDHTVLLTKDEPDKIKRINAAHKGDDPGPGGLNFVRNLKNGAPKWTHRGVPVNDLFLLKGNEAPLDRSKVKKGDRIPGWVLARPKGSRGIINAKGKFYPEKTKWVLEIGRKLISEDKEHDIQFSDLTKAYYFGLAVWDNDKLQAHTRVRKPIKISFK